MAYLSLLFSQMASKQLYTANMKWQNNFAGSYIAKHL